MLCAREPLIKLLPLNLKAESRVLGLALVVCK